MGTSDDGLNQILIQARQSVARRWKGTEHKLGSQFFRAMLCEEILFIAASQAPSVSDAIVRRIVNEGFSWAVETSNLEA